MLSARQIVHNHGCTTTGILKVEKTRGTTQATRAALVPRPVASMAAASSPGLVGQDHLLPPGDNTKEISGSGALNIHALPPAPALLSSDAVLQLTPQQKESYATSGYCLCPGLIEPDAARGLQHAVDEMLASAAGMPREQTELFDFEESHTPEQVIDI